MKRIRKTIVVLLLSAVLCTGAALFLIQPLLPSNRFKVNALLNGNPIEAKLLSPPFMPGLYYIHLPDAEPRRYRWFGIAFTRQSVFSPVALYPGWGSLTYIHTDQAKGVNLTDGKIEDHWTVAFKKTGVEFSNGSLGIKLSDAP